MTMDSVIFSISDSVKIRAHISMVLFCAVFTKIVLLNGHFSIGNAMLAVHLKTSQLIGNL